MNAPSVPFAMRLTALRQELSKRGLDGFLVPRVDEHQGEYVPARAQRLTWLTGFDGSAGVAAVLANQAAIFVDGRYTVQVRQQVDGGLFAYKHLIEEPPEAWLAKELKAGQRLGVDPWLMSLAQKRRLEAALAPAKIELVLLDSNPLDQVWQDQPVAPQAPVKPHAPEFAGESSAKKRQRIGQAIAEKAADLAMLTLPDSICWLINVRGSDVERTPFALSFALIGTDGGLTWFIDPAKLTAQVKAELDPAIKILPPSEMAGALASLKGKRVLVDAGTVPVWVVSRLTAAGAEVVEGVDPCQLPKAKKNPVEIQGMRQAHRRDGVAVSRLLSWFEREVEKGGLTESAVADRLEAFRREDNLLQDLSFDTIAGTGPNGSVVHYRVTPATNRPIAKGDVMVLDSGGQYLDGTTDITRTLVAGQPSAEARDRHTRVLKGHIALATARFPKGTTGHQLDVLARLPLWQAGLDYDHGTGHGVGAYLSVHEGPQNISKRAVPVPLEAGMIVSNEPGYYKNGAYGMRVENLVPVVESPKAAGEEREMLAFETLTLAPIERKLIDKSLLSADEIAWVDAYHALVEAEVGPKLSGADRAWLAEACRPL